jgi:hypothetical protein
MMALHEMILCGMIPPVPPDATARRDLPRSGVATFEPKSFRRAMWLL